MSIIKSKNKVFNERIGKDVSVWILNTEPLTV